MPRHRYGANAVAVRFAPGEVDGYMAVVLELNPRMYRYAEDGSTVIFSDTIAARLVMQEIKAYRDDRDTGPEEKALCDSQITKIRAVLSERGC